MDDKKIEKLKIDLIVIGNPNSGKTSLIKRFIVGECNQTIIQNLLVISILQHLA